LVAEFVPEFAELFAAGAVAAKDGDGDGGGHAEHPQIGRGLSAARGGGEEIELGEAHA
jgi:hypothetical protein